MLSSVALLFNACSSADELVDPTPLTPWPSITYINAPQITSLVPGYNTVEVNWKLVEDENVTRTAIYYNNKKDSIVVAKTSGEMTTKLTNVEEGTQSIILRNYGEDATVYSTTDRESVAVYGDNYKASYGDGRPITDMAFDTTTGELTITWGESEDYTGGTLTYVNSSDVETTVDVSVDEGTTVLADAVSYGNFSYTSDYMPAQGCDAFTVESSNMMFPAHSTLDLPSDITVQGGLKRAIVKWTASSLAGAEVVLFWGPSAEESLTLDSSAGAMEYEVSDLPDGDYDFSVYMKSGTEVSTAISASASVYGDEYVASLGTGRSIQSVAYNDRGAVVLWSRWPTGCTSVDFSYTDESGSPKTKTLTADSDAEMILADAMEGGVYSYVTKYLPEGGLDAVEISSADDLMFPSYSLISPENVEVYPGDGRALVMWNDPFENAADTEITISWDGCEAPVTLPSTGNEVPEYAEYYTEGGGKASYFADNAYLIESIEPGTRVVKLSYSRTDADYKSTEVSDIVVVYDMATYAVSLAALNLEFLSYTEAAGAKLTFNSNSTSGNTNIMYTNVAGEAVTKVVSQPESASAVMLADAAPATHFEYNTEYYPSATALDKVVSPNVKKTVPGPIISNANYKYVGLAGDMDCLDENSYPFTKMWDGSKIGAFFHSGPLDNKGQTITIDLGQMVEMTTLILYPRDNYVLRHNDVKNFRIYGAAKLDEDMYTPTTEQETAVENGMAAQPEYVGWTQMGDNVSSKFYDKDAGTYLNFIPSGYSVAESADVAYRETYGTEVDIDIDANEPIRYLRIEMIDNWGATTSFAVGEVEVTGVVTTAFEDLTPDAYDDFLASQPTDPIE